jgi:GxxExxY protein
MNSSRAKAPRRKEGKAEYCTKVALPMSENELARIVVDVAYQIHRRLGPGLLESAYQAIMAYELRQRGLHVETEVPIPVVWGDVQLEIGFRVDLWVERLLLVELKSIDALVPVHKKQMLTYLRLTDTRLGLLINFGAELIKEGIVRLVNGLPDPT